MSNFNLITDFPPLPENYPISAKIISDSVSVGLSPERLTTLEIEFPRYILAEFNTHRAFSKNTSSSRAIPTKKMIENSRTNFVKPVRFGKNQAGMQAAKENLVGVDYAQAELLWSSLAEITRLTCEKLADLGLHKQWASRPMEWFITTKMVVSATEFNNFFFLRDHFEAQDEICYLAQKIKIAMNGSCPLPKKPGEWHLPYVTHEELRILGLRNALKVSAARCARVSYRVAHGVTSSLEEDLDLFKRLTHDMDFETNPFHASPTEHQATPISSVTKTKNYLFRKSNFAGWAQYRKYIEQDIPVTF